MMIFNGVIKCLLRLLKLRFPPSLVPTPIDPIPMGSYRGLSLEKKVSFLIINPSKSPKWVIWGSVDPF